MAVQHGLHEGRSGPGASHNEHRGRPNDRLQADRRPDRLPSRAVVGVIPDFRRSGEPPPGPPPYLSAKMSPMFPVLQL